MIESIYSNGNINLNDNTLDLLRCIASHLGTRLHRMEFYVDVSIHRHINLLDDRFSPIVIQIYPDREHRKNVDKVDLIKHVLDSHFTSDVDFISGIYRYTLSFNKKKRKWVKFKEDSYYDTHIRNIH